MRHFAPHPKNMAGSNCPGNNGLNVIAAPAPGFLFHLLPISRPTWPNSRVPR